jgi:hypothetical protein
MNGTMPFTTEGKESAGSEHGRSTQGDLRDNAAAPRLIACLLLVPACSLRAYNRVGALLWQVEGVPHGVVPKKRIEVLVDELHGGR